jgi:hypothetical protein
MANENGSGVLDSAVFDDRPANRRVTRSISHLALTLTVVTALILGGCQTIPTPVSPAAASPAPPALISAPPSAVAATYHDYAGWATQTLLHGFYHDAGWRSCALLTCRSVNRDWGADSLTYTLYLRWQTTHDPSLVTYFKSLVSTAPQYPPPCHGIAGLACTFSDAPQWDVVAALREYEVTGKNPIALDRAVKAFETIEGSTIYTGGVCPAIRYQQPYGYLDHLKTLETEATAVKAALLLYRFTASKRYLTIAIQRYANARRYFLDANVPLYTVFVFDAFGKCAPLPHRFFASVNGEMISNGIMLYRRTGNAHYRAQAFATAQAVDDRLSDARGIFADLLADNDIVEPLVEAMYDLATSERVDFARAWLLRNADATASARKPDGTYGRFFDGPPAPGTVTAWQTNGGFSLMIAADAIAPAASPLQTSAWAGARFVKHTILIPYATLTFGGSGIALIGTLGDLTPQPGHERVFIDGVETFNGTGIWQNSTSSLKRLPGTVLFAWRWPKAGPHTLEFRPGIFNLKEGGAYIHVTSYFVE